VWWKESLCGVSSGIFLFGVFVDFVLSSTAPVSLVPSFRMDVARRLLILFSAFRFPTIFLGCGNRYPVVHSASHPHYIRFVHHADVLVDSFDNLMI